MHTITRWGLVGFMAFLFTACSGEDGIDGTGLHGTAATGAPIANTTVMLRDRTGNKVSTETDTTGKYSFDLTDLTPPFLIKTTTADSQTFYSIANRAGTNNINPLTDVVARNWFLSRGRDIGSEFENSGPITSPPSTTQINALVDALVNLLVVSYEVFKLDKKYDFLHNPFEADNTGFDRLLDHTVVTIASNTLSIDITNPDSSVVLSIIFEFNFTTDLSDDGNITPSKPQGLSLASATGPSLQLLWNASRDNVGVSSYNIYRKTQTDSLYIPWANSIVPFYSDTDLETGTEYCYKVEALDDFGNISPLSDAECGSTGTSNTNAGSAWPFLPMIVNTTKTLSSMYVEKEGETVDYSWTLTSNPDGDFVLDVGNKSEFEFTPIVTGQYGFMIEISDTEGTPIETENGTVDVLVPPVADAGGPDFLTTVGVPVALSGIDSTAPDGYELVEVTWTVTSMPDLGDYYFDPGIDSNPLTVDFTPFVKGTYTIDLTVSIVLPTGDGVEIVVFETIKSAAYTVTITVDPALQ